MNSKQIWATTDDGKIDIISLTNEYIPGTVEVLHAFYKDEAACLSLGVPGDEESMAEFDEFNLQTAKDGLSIVAVERSTNKVCGVLFNKVQKRNDPDSEEYINNFLKKCKSPLTSNLFQMTKYANEHCNLYEHCNVDCLMELEFLGTLPEFRKRGIARKLCQVSEILAKKLIQGENVRTALDGSVMPVGLIPKILIATFSSPFSKAVGRSLNWEIAAIVKFDNFVIDGKLYNDIPPMTLEYKRLVRK